MRRGSARQNLQCTRTDSRAMHSANRSMDVQQTHPAPHSHSHSRSHSHSIARPQPHSRSNSRSHSQPHQAAVKRITASVHTTPYHYRPAPRADGGAGEALRHSEATAEGRELRIVGPYGVGCCDTWGVRCRIPRHVRPVQAIRPSAVRYISSHPSICSTATSGSGRSCEPQMFLSGLFLICTSYHSRKVGEIRLIRWRHVHNIA